MTCEDNACAPAVRRGLLFEGSLVTIRENHCNRHDADLSPRTEPMPYHEVVFGQDGLWCRHEGRRSLPVDAHHVHFFAKGQSFRVSHPLGCGDRNTGIAVDAEWLAEATGGADGSRGSNPGMTHRRIDARLAAAHRLLVRAARRAHRSPLSSLALEERALQLVRTALGSEPPQARGALTWRQRDLVERTRAALHGRLDDPLTLGGVAAAVGCSPYHMARTFSAATGTTPMRYRAMLRLERAIALLLETDMALVDIAAHTGFADRSHLTRVVRKALGIGPRGLRQSEWDAVSRRLLDSDRTQA